MKIKKSILDDKIQLFVLAGIAQNEGKGWDYAIPQSMFDDLQCMGIENPGQWFAADCTNISTKLHHIGEAYVNILRHRSGMNEEFIMAMSYDKDARGKAVYNFILSTDTICAEADAGFIDLNHITRAFHEGTKFENEYILVSEMAPKRPDEKPWRLVLRKNLMGEGYVSHIHTMDDNGFHIGNYYDNLPQALMQFCVRCEDKNLEVRPSR